jgi:hypothetical protein
MNRRGDVMPSKEQLIRMREARMGTPSIAKAVGCDQSSIRYWLKKYGLPTGRVQPATPSDGQVDAWIERFKPNKIKRAAE